MTARKAREEQLPGKDDCLRMLREAGCDQAVVDHCVAVSELAVKIAKKCRADLELVRVGGLLHDLGRCKTHDIHHAIEGAKIGRELNLPKTIVTIIERHIGGGISPTEAVRLGLPEKDYTPVTLEEKIVAHADNLMSGSRRTRIQEAVTHLTRKGEYEAAQKVLRLHEELSAKCRMNLDDIF